jgi:hypothetical protein
LLVGVMFEAGVASWQDSVLLGVARVLFVRLCDELQSRPTNPHRHVGVFGEPFGPSIGRSVPCRVKASWWLACVAKWEVTCLVHLSDVYSCMCVLA